MFCGLGLTAGGRPKATVKQYHTYTRAAEAASAAAAAEGVDRKRTNKIAYKSSQKEQKIGSEQYDPYLDIADSKFSDDMSMSMPAGAGGGDGDDKSR